MDRCALFVDAGYVLGDGALAVHGTRNRESVSWDYAGVLGVLKNVARDHTGLPLLRCYWYEATVEGRRSPEHETLADLPGVKLRLGKIKPGRREGVESEIHRDLTTLARNRAISDALVVSAEEDLAQVISDVQDLGLRVILVHIAAPGCTAAAALRQECDEIVEISETHLRPSAELVVGAEPVTEDERQAVAVHASRATANGHGPHGVIGQPSLPAGAHAAPPPIYTGSVIAEYQRAAQPGNNHRRPAQADGAGPAAGNHTLAGVPPGAQPGMAPPPGAVPHPAAPARPGAGPGGAPGSRDITGQPTLPPAPPQSPAVGQPGPAAQPVGGTQTVAGQPIAGQPIAGQPVGGPPFAGQPVGGQQGVPGPLAGPPVPGHHAAQGLHATPGQHAGPGLHATPGQHAGPGHHAAVPGHYAAPGPALLPPGQPGPAQASAPLAAPPPYAQPPPRGGQHAGPPVAHPESGPAIHSQHARPGLPSQQFPPGQPVPGQPAIGPLGPGQPVPGPVAPGQPGALGYQAPAGQPGPQGPQPRPGRPAYQTAPPPPAPPSAPPPPAALPSAALPPAAAPPGFPGQAPDLAGGQAPAAPRPPTAGAPPGPGMPTAPPGGVPALSAARPGQQLRGLPGGYPAGPPGLPPGGPADPRAQQFPMASRPPDAGPYVPQQGPHSGPQPAAQHALVPQPVSVSLADAVQAAHGEGFNFGQAVARDAPALWLEAVLARKPRMPSDLEARLLQDSSLPIDSLLHDEVRHALRRGFWDALERVRH